MSETCPKCGKPADDINTTNGKTYITYECDSMLCDGAFVRISSDDSCLLGEVEKLSAELTALRERCERDKQRFAQLAVALGYKAPGPDADPFWFRDDHGPVHEDDLWDFVVGEVQSLREQREMDDVGEDTRFD